jgi:hypothetical protein
LRIGTAEFLRNVANHFLERLDFGKIQLSTLLDLKPEIFAVVQQLTPILPRQFHDSVQMRVAIEMFPKTNHNNEASRFTLVPVATMHGPLQAITHQSIIKATFS